MPSNFPPERNPIEGFPIIVISLNDSKGRRKTITDIMKYHGLSFPFQDAIDVRKGLSSQ